ncbi:MAG: four helix bundle protein [Candidatus Omnitrophota bacterium]|nr:four helix bundle protein [Candidatus Omnitrophota bacterium]
MGFHFEKLEVYKKAIEFVDAIYLSTNQFPKKEIFGLTSQLRRASVSIPLNVAEGSARSRKDFCRFIDISRGSILECSTILQISLNQKYINADLFQQLYNQLIQLYKMLNGLKRSLEDYEPRTMN